jgi:uncharacterized oxidoreductase
MNLSGNTILLTGGTSGIGLKLLEQFYRQNKVIVVSASRSNLQKIREQFPRVETIPCNLANAGEVQQLITTCLTHHNDINILINNAGVQYNYDFVHEKDGYRKVTDEIQINLTSPLHLTYGLLPLLIKKNEAALINVSSGLLYAPKKSAPVYCGTKAALHSVTKALRYQLENTRVTVFEIIPPLVNTSITAGRSASKISPAALVDEFMENFRRNIPESNIGKTKILKTLNRIAPKLADKIMKDR